MNTLRQTLFNKAALLLCLITIGVNGQKQIKTFEETFNISDDAILNIDTSHTDIEFETWTKNQIVVEAFIEIDGATDEEAERYFKNEPIEIIGNSKKVTVSTKGNNQWVFTNEIGDFHDLHIEMPELPEMQSFDFNFDFDELRDMPTLPISTAQKFDYKAFKKDGEKYLKKWQKEFEKGFDKEHRDRLEEWGKRMETRQERMAERHDKLSEKRMKMHERKAEVQVKRLAKRAESRSKILDAHNRGKAMHLKMRKNKGFSNDSTFVFISTDSLGSHGPSIFYGSSLRGHKNYKVKKTIKIKMPKAMKIKMNVRHGEVKLAENTKNLNATLSHASLLAATIDGDKTTIKASYTPVSVQKWNYGQLQANYSELVNLKEVLNLRMNATSSHVVIDHLVNSAFIKNNFGPLKINSVSKNFTDINISLQNAKLDCKTPSTPFTIYINETSSKLSSPASIILDRTKNHNTIVHKGYHINRSQDRSIAINSDYSEVVLH